MKQRLPEILLRIGLGVSFLYPGISMFREPGSWIGWIPPIAAAFLPSRLPPLYLLWATAVFDILIGLWLFSGLFLRIATLLAAIHLLSILLFSGFGTYVIIFRDMGLFFASLALYFLVKKK